MIHAIFAVSAAATAALRDACEHIRIIASLLFSL
jgi:hypothetical protein